MSDPNATPHGPAEMFDIFTHRVTVAGEQGLAAFILKGRSFSTVRPHDVSHQIFRLRDARGLRFAVFAAVGNVLDRVKHEFVTTALDLGLDYALFDANDIARLMIGYGFICPRDGKRLETGRCTCGYKPDIEDLNILQQDALARLADTHKANKRAGLIVMPTGSGKTRVAVNDVKVREPESVLYVAHTHEILDGAKGEFAAMFGAVDVLHVRSSSDLVAKASIKMATVQLLAKHYEWLQANKPDYMIVDEFHHAVAPSYRSIIKAARPTFLLGLTATPFRADWQNIFELCDDNLIVNHELRFGIDSGILCPYHYYGCFDNVDYSKILSKSGLYSIKDLERALVIPKRDEAIVAKWFELANEKPTLAFCCSQLHAERVAEAFRKVDVPAATYTHSTPWEERQQLLDNLKQGTLRVLCSIDVLNEGVDIPFVECLMFLRPTESKRIFFQQLGRGLRRYPGKFSVKVIDFIGNFRNAYKIIEYQALNPKEDEEQELDPNVHLLKDVLTLPLGCSVEFDNRVIDIFEGQFRDGGKITRQNIAQLLIYYYKRLCKRRGKLCDQNEVNQYQILPLRYIGRCSVVGKAL